jgi:hypothetical protein
MKTKIFLLFSILLLCFNAALHAQVPLGSIEKSKSDSTYIYGTNPKGVADGRGRFLPPSQWGHLVLQGTTVATIDLVGCNNSALANRTVKTAAGLFMIDPRGCAIQTGGNPLVTRDTRLVPKVQNDSLLYDIIDANTLAVITPNAYVFDNAFPRYSKFNEEYATLPYPVTANSTIITTSRTPVAGNSGKFDIEVFEDDLSLAQGSGFTVTGNVVKVVNGAVATVNGTNTVRRYTIKYRSQF